MSTWYRICVDLDRSGSVVGGSWERHDDDVLNLVVVLAAESISPFDDPAEAFAQVLHDAAVRCGFQPTLFD